MKAKLETAKRYLAANEVEAIAHVAVQIKDFPRQENGLFATNEISENLFEAAGYVYPVYAAYETECNKKEGYPDLLAQMRVLEGMVSAGDSLEDMAYFLEALLETIDNVSPQLYEYYRELVDMFRTDLKLTIDRYYVDGMFQKVNGKGNRSANERLKKAIAHAAETKVILGEKYQTYM